MKNIKIDFNRISNNKKNQIIVCIVLCIIVIIGFFIANNIISKNKFQDYEIIDDISVINSVENIYIENNYIIVEGYAFLADEDSVDTSVSLFLINPNSSNEVLSDTMRIDRDDVNSYFMSEYNYESSGFRASFKDSDLEDDASYEILIDVHYTDNYSNEVRKTISSKRFIHNNKLYDYNPNEFEKPQLEVNPGLLNSVFSEGQLCFYQKDAGMYIYQYQGKMYWIATDDFKFDENGKTYIPYHIHTSQIDKLPVDRILHEYDNQNFIFEQNEDKDETTDSYRVAIRDIPNDYAITYIRTGRYNADNNEWIWMTQFHLDNLFNTKN